MSSKKKLKQQKQKGLSKRAESVSNMEQLDRYYSHTIKPDNTKSKPLEAKNEMQGLYISSITCNTLTFGIGPAGTGKTFVASALAAEMLDSRQISKIIITRPAEQVEEDHGALPGELDEKYLPYIQPFIDAFEKKLGKGKTGYLLKRKIIDARPLAFMRGSNFEDAFVILDEAQNCSPKQMKMFLTRIGPNCRVVVNGDEKQSDISGRSGLTDAIDRLEGMKDCSVVEFSREDIVRSGIVRQILDRYES